MPTIGLSESELVICAGCYSMVRMYVTQNGIKFCPKCGYSPTLGHRLASSTVPIKQENMGRENGSVAAFD